MVRVDARAHSNNVQVNNYQPHEIVQQCTQPWLTWGFEQQTDYFAAVKFTSRHLLSLSLSLNNNNGCPRCGVLPCCLMLFHAAPALASSSHLPPAPLPWHLMQHLPWHLLPTMVCCTWGMQGGVSNLLLSTTTCPHTVCFLV